MNQITRGVMRPSIFGTNHLREEEKNFDFGRHDRTVGLPGQINEYNTASIQSLEGGAQRIYRRIFFRAVQHLRIFSECKTSNHSSTCSNWRHSLKNFLLLMKFTTVRELKACLWPILNTDLWFMKHCRKTRFMSCFHVWCALRCSKNIHGF